MAKLTIPSALIPALTKLSALSEESVEELLRAINSAPPILNPEMMASKVGELTPSIQPDDVTGIFEAVFSFSAVRTMNNFPIADFLEDVCEALSTRKVELDRDKLRNRLEKLLQAPSMVLAAKASSIQREHPSLFLNARIFTDLRPVFGDVPESMQAAVVFHTLKLTYAQSNETQEFFVSLDDGDLAKLQRAIVRAETKSKYLRAFIEKSGLPDVDPKQN